MGARKRKRQTRIAGGGNKEAKTAPGLVPKTGRGFMGHGILAAEKSLQVCFQHTWASKRMGK